MNVSIYSVHLREVGGKDGYDALLREYFERGIRYADGLEKEIADDGGLRGYYNRITASGMGVSCFVATSDIITEGAMLEANISKVKGYIDELSSLGVDKIMLAPAVMPADNREDFYRMRERMVDAFGAMAEYAKGSGVKVTIENQSVAQRADSFIVDCKYILDRLPEVGFVLDAGNFYCVGDDVLVAYELFKSRIVHAHIKDWEEYRYGRIIRSYLPPLASSEMGKGVLPLDELLSRMKSDGYSGTLLLEINGRPIPKSLVDQSADYLLSFCN